jgi:hypothetical protein
MAGMSRDKCGAAAIAGFMKTVELRKPEDVHVIAVLCMVRNNVGEECYVADEIITSRAGVRVRVGNIFLNIIVYCCHCSETVFCCHIFEVIPTRKGGWRWVTCYAP